MEKFYPGPCGCSFFGLHWSYGKPGYPSRKEQNPESGPYQAGKDERDKPLTNALP